MGVILGRMSVTRIWVGSWMVVGFLWVGCGAPSVSKADRQKTTPAKPTQEEQPNVAAAFAAKEDAALLALGRTKFMEGCAKCHDEHGEKPLEDGSVLREMEFTEDELAEKVEHRAHDFPEEEQRAILLYVKSFLSHPPISASKLSGQ